VDFVFLNAATTKIREGNTTVENVSFVLYRGEGNRTVENVFFINRGRFPPAVCWAVGAEAYVLWRLSSGSFPS